VLTSATEMWDYRGLIGNLAQRELKAKYKKSVLGWAWSLINPFATLLIYTLVFGTFLRIQPPIAGNGHLKNFALYLFAALIIWNFFNATIVGGMVSLIGNGPLIKKVYFPAECTIIATTLATLLQACIESMILAVVMVVFGNVSLTFLFFPVILALLVLFCLGISLVAALVNAYFRDVNYIVTIMMNLLFYATPIIYPLRIVPKQVGGLPMRAIISLNPLAQFIQASRSIFYSLRLPSLASFAYLSAWSFGIFAIGWIVFSRLARDVSEEL
jgi:ABC-type polysaccharide/polyol phosphate export permease